MCGLLCPTFAWAQQDPSPTLLPYFLDTTRFESWAFFQPPSSSTGDPTYSLLGNRATLGVRLNSRRFDVEGAFQYAQLVGLPRRANGPGPLGPGHLYYDAARNTGAYQLYFKLMSIRLKELLPGVSLEIGRMTYSSNPESRRLAGRLIGDAEWTMSERAFDGGRLDYSHPNWRAHASFVMPTQGAYEESANPTIGNVQLATVSFAAGGLNVFGHHYRDKRPIAVRPDNSFGTSDRVDISIGTAGVSHVREYGTRAMRLDTVAWGATQFGRWYTQTHHAVSGIAEAGVRWPLAAWQPAVRAGIVYASGDDTPLDSAHRTFFPMVPTTRPNVLAGTYAQMNLRDVSAEVRLQPHSRVAVTTVVHRLSLADAQDRWYSGTGATAFNGEYFGYSTRFSRLATDLGTFVEATAEASVMKHWSIKASAGYVHGGQVVRRQFNGHRLGVFALESRVTFE